MKTNDRSTQRETRLKYICWSLCVTILPELIARQFSVLAGFIAGLIGLITATIIFVHAAVKNDNIIDLYTLAALVLPGVLYLVVLLTIYIIFGNGLQ